MKKYLPLLISAIVGVATWVGIGIWIGREEAWDSQLYWSVGFPFMIIAVLLIAFIWPEKPWRWGVYCNCSAGNHRVSSGISAC